MRAIGPVAITGLLVLTYMVLVGGTNLGELSPMFAAVSVALTLPFLAVYAVRGPAAADRIDRLSLLALLLFIGACLLSAIPRLSFEPALAALAYAAFLFVGRGVLASPAARGAFTWTLIALSVVMTALTAARWSGFLLEWMSLTGGTTLPPLNMELPSFPWAHRHDLALLVTMLYPAWWLGETSTLRRVLAVVVGAVVAVIVIVDGSRMLWLAIISASLAVSAMTVARRGTWSPRLDRRAGVALLAIGVGAVGLLVITGAAGAMVQRIFTFESVGWRTAMWSSLLDSWLAHPVAGSGPGTFPWALQGTDYFDTTSFAPRHPDSAPIQLLAEGGFLGLAAAVVVLIAVVPGLVGNRQKAALWAVTAFAVASLGSNPTDFAFMVVTAIAWTAYGLPRDNATAERAASPRWLIGARVGAMAVIGAAWLLTWFGALAYADARSAVGRDDYAAAANALETATALDPGMPLYVRELGTLRYATGDPGPAGAELLRVTAMNPWDDLAWRTLAAAETATADDAEAEGALVRAVEVQRSDPTNLLLQAQAALGRGEAEVAQAALAEVVQAWPFIVFAPEWNELIDGAPFGPDDVVADAAQRWIDGLPAPEMVEDQGLWLLGMSGMAVDYDRAIAESGYTTTLGGAMTALLRCEPATAVLSEPSSGDLQSSMYWRLRLRDAALTSTPDPEAAGVVGWAPRQNLTRDPLNPLEENSVRGTSADLWGYRRASIDWPLIDRPLPAPRAGLVAWLEGSDCER